MRPETLVPGPGGKPASFHVDACPKTGGPHRGAPLGTRVQGLVP